MSLTLTARDLPWLSVALLVLCVAIAGCCTRDLRTWRCVPKEQQIDARSHP